MSSSVALLFSALVGLQLAQAQELPAAFGPPPGSNPITWGLYATPEIQEETSLEIEGSIPSWISGSLYRGAAATWDVGNYTTEHWFDGFSRNHRFDIANGEVTYQSRNASDEKIAFVRETGLYPGGSFGGDPCKAIFGAFEVNYRDGNVTHGDKDSDSIPVAFIPNFAGLDRNSSNTGAPFDTLVSTTDANRLQQFDPATLEPIELFTYQASNEVLDNGGRTAAHPVVGEDGSVYNYLLDMSKEQPVYRIFGITPGNNRATILANITNAPPAYIHSLFGTEKHLILIVWQADLVNEAKNIVDSLGKWDPERKSLFYVIDRDNGGIVSKYESEEAFFAFHQVNSFEDEAGDILIDLPTFEDLDFIDTAYIRTMRENVGVPNGTYKADLAGRFTRYRLPYHGKDSKSSNGTLVTHTTEVDFAISLREANIELARINEKYAGKPYKYAYGCHTEKPGFFSDSIIKIDTEEKKWKIWSPSVNHLPSEPIFIANPDGECEDDGVLVTVALDVESKKSSLIFIDAQTMEEIGRARMPIIMGYGFHGIYGSAV